MRPGKARRRALQRIERMAEQRLQDAELEAFAFPLHLQEAEGHGGENLFQRDAGEQQVAAISDR